MSTENAALADARQIVVDRLVEGGVGLHEARLDERLLVARLVVSFEEPVGVLGDNNEVVDWKSIPEAIRDGDAFFAKSRDHILALDFDESDAIQRAHGAYAALRVTGHLPVLIASGQVNRRHVFCVMPPSRRRDLERHMKFSKKEFRDTIRPPLTPHRWHGKPGVHEALLLPSAVEDAIERLRPVGRGGRALGPTAVGVLRRSDARPQASGSEAIFSLAKGAVNAGWTVDELLVLLTSGMFPICTAFASRCVRDGPEKAVRWVLDHVWPDAVAVVTENPPRRPGNNPRGLSLLAWGAAQSWPGRTGASDRNVYLALVEKHLRSGANPVDASIREICVLAGISGKDTVSKSLDRLQSQGLIEKRPIVAGRRGRAPDRRSDAYFLSDPPASEMPEIVTPGQDLTAKILGGLDSDAFRNLVGYGQRAHQVYDLILTHSGITTQQLLTSVGASRPTIRSTLRRLVTAELIQGDDRGWVVGPNTPDDVVRGTPMQGRGERQREAFERERRALDRRRE